MKKNLKARLELASLLDVMFLVLVFFIYCISEMAVHKGERVDLPVAAYSVSGEYAMVKAAAANGWVDEEKIFCEMAVAAYRAGAGIYLSYYAKELARFIREGRIG